ncbi:hypothetical protein OC846_004958 [Tilletia horrida]|uniref:Uncharacterized protein n=1 Tax=Tilletia horrida TaxID=155126 RepID=A0AAN6GNV5_9BASI|nr:hypothetical protein OC845_004651 [Tilletia horrida]KAK0547203.1 hypothetical protein OC846_004958 [Tilletia horrida]KAK0563781.1 hypothetical protein OC861_004627 [Tilletia horrida]
MPRSRGVEFCCFALPLVNFGAYAIVLENAFVALCLVILAVAPPQIVALMGGATPATIAKIVVVALGVIILVWQLLGLVAINRQSTRSYQFYLRINTILTLAVIGATAAFLAIGAARHSTAVDACIAQFGTVQTSSGNSATDVLSGVINDGAKSGSTICNAFVWVQVGAMAGLIVLLGLTQLYMLFCQRAYGQKQRAAASELKAETGAADNIPLSHRDSTTWDPYNANPAAGDAAARYSESHDYVAPAQQAGGMYSSHNNPAAGVYETQPYATYSQPAYDSAYETEAGRQGQQPHGYYGADAYAAPNRNSRHQADAY